MAYRSRSRSGGRSYGRRAPTRRSYRASARSAPRRRASARRAPGRPRGPQTVRLEIVNSAANPVSRPGMALNPAFLAANRGRKARM